MKRSDIAYAKINLALHVRQRREDGYHELETLFAFAEEGDLLTAEPADELSLVITGRFAPGLSAGPDNLVLLAAEWLRERSGFKRGAQLTLDKRLPVASGIGGGSADAAAALRLLARLWEVELPPAEAALALGADVPACLASVTVQGEGVGERLAPASVSVTGLPALLANPGLPCPTGAVFAGWDGVDRGALVAADWRQGRNDLEVPAVTLFPAISKVLAALGECRGATLVRMSGSGATCFALFDTLTDRDKAAGAIAAQYPGWWVLPTRLR